MPRHCSAGGCKSRDNRETRNAGITFHRLPKQAARRNLWITNSQRADSWNPQTDFVYFCSKHFTPESFELTGCSGIRRLKEDAFPTVFESFSTKKYKKAVTQRVQKGHPVRSPFSSNQECTRHETVHSQYSEEPKVLRSVATEVTGENKSASPQGLSAPSPPPEPRALSPSRYIRRLPPPSGFYLSKEHSYAQLCPLLWRRRYDQSIDCLERTLRQLHAARRRENRLRNTVLRLRDKQLKHTLLVSQDACKNRMNWTPGGKKRRGEGGSNEEESPTVDTGSFEGRYVDPVKLGVNFLSDPNRLSKEERGYCFYCGRGQVQVGGHIAHKLSNAKEMFIQDSESIQRTPENSRDIQIVSLEWSIEKEKETKDSDIAHSQVHVQTPDLQHGIPTGVSLPATYRQSVQFVGSQEKQILSDLCERESESVHQEYQTGLHQQLFWIQESAEGQAILVPFPTEVRLQNFLKIDRVIDDTQAIWVSELDIIRNMGQMDIGDLAFNDEHSDQQLAINSIPMEKREEVREKLKEHLEGFHLQLSSEFINYQPDLNEHKS